MWLSLMLYWWCDGNVVYFFSWCAGMCVHVPVKVCVGVCDALVCRLIFVYLSDNNEGFIFADKTLE